MAETPDENVSLSPPRRVIGQNAPRDDSKNSTKVNPSDDDQSSHRLFRPTPNTPRRTSAAGPRRRRRTSGVA
jgi:hypothetical protein